MNGFLRVGAYALRRRSLTVGQAITGKTRSATLGDVLRVERVIGPAADLHAGNVDITMDICDMQLPDNRFDFIYCSHVLEHVTDDRKAMREFYRVLSPRGMAFLLVPITAEVTFEDPTVTDPKERLRLFGLEDHVRVYGKDYTDRLRQSGFDVEEVKPGDFLDAEEIKRMGITSSAGSLFICYKH